VIAAGAGPVLKIFGEAYPKEGANTDHSQHSGDIVVNPGLKSDRDRGRCLTALQREVAGADQMAHRAVTDPNRQAPQPHSGARAVRLDALGSRRLDTRYSGWVAIRQRVAVGRCGSLV
jgi:hypothetical protein